LILRTLGRGLLAAAVVSSAVLGVATAPAQAAADPADLTISATRLVFEPGERGYTGSYQVSITNTGDEAQYANVRVVEPVAGSFRELRPGGGGCITEFLSSGRTANVCFVPGDAIQPGATRRFRVSLVALTAPQAFAMRGPDTTTQIVGAGSALLATATSRTLFRSTTGELTQPRPYVQDDHTDISVGASDVRLTEQADGSFLGRVPVTVRWNGDAPHWDLSVTTAVSEGFELSGNGPEQVCGYAECIVPGSAFVTGESRTIEVEISAPAGTPVGTEGTGTVGARASWFTELPEADSSDNTATFHIAVG
jgi:hypothetical protein